MKTNLSLKIANYCEDIGGAAICSYHHLRKTQDLLTLRFSPTKPLEVVGDFFLTPAHYLLVGRTVSYIKVKNTFSAKNTFNYEKHFLLKTLSSILLLIPCTIIGASLKSLSHLSPPIKKRNRKWKLVEAKMDDHSEIYKKIGADKTKDEFIPSLKLAKPPLTEKQKLQRDACKEIFLALEKAKIPHWIDCGTALGAYRHEGMIPWDTDNDISALEIDHNNLLNALKGLDPKKYDVLDFSSCVEPKSYIRVHIKKAKACVDIYHYRIDEAKKTVNYHFPFENSYLPESLKERERATTAPVAYETIFPLKRANFDGITCYAPNDIVSFLQSKYGQDLTPSKVWNKTTQQYEKVEGHPYWENHNW